MLLIIIIGNYNYLCRVPGGVRFYCVTWRDALFRTAAAPPPQTKTLKTKRVFLYRVLRLCSSDREGNGKLCDEFKFSYIGRTGSENFCS